MSAKLLLEISPRVRRRWLQRRASWRYSSVDGQLFIPVDWGVMLPVIRSFWLLWLSLVMVLLDPPMPVMEYYLKSGHNSFLPHSFQFIIYQSSYHFKWCSVNYWKSLTPPCEKSCRWWQSTLGNHLSQISQYAVIHSVSFVPVTQRWQWCSHPLLLAFFGPFSVCCNLWLPSPCDTFNDSGWL